MCLSLVGKTVTSKRIMTSLVQIILLVILLPFIAIVIRLIMPDQIGEILKNIFDEIPIVKVLSNYFLVLAQTKELNSFSLFEYTIETVSETILGTYIVGIWVYIFKHLGELIGLRGLPVLQTIIGILVSCFCLRFIGDDIRSNILCVLILAVIAFGIAIIVRKGNIGKFALDIGVGIGMATITSATVSAYCTVLVLIMRGMFGSLWEGIYIAFLALIPATICLLIDYLLFGRKY